MIKVIVKKLLILMVKENVSMGEFLIFYNRVALCATEDIHLCVSCLWNYNAAGLCNARLAQAYDVTAMYITIFILVIYFSSDQCCSVAIISCRNLFSKLLNDYRSSPVSVVHISNCFYKRGNFFLQTQIVL